MPDLLYRKSRQRDTLLRVAALIKWDKGERLAHGGAQEVNDLSLSSSNDSKTKWK